ncbi:MAG: hypothetical protein V3T07_02990 [Myxococcota bacterium]
MHAAVLLALTTNLFPRTDWGHLVFVLPSACVQLVLVSIGRPGRPSRPAVRHRARWAASLVFVLAVGDTLAARSILGRAGPATLGPRVPYPPVTPQLRSQEPARVIAFLRENTEPGESIFVPRSEPLIYFATDTRNPTPYSGIVPGMRAAQERAILAALEDVRFVVMSDIDQPWYTYYREELPAVQKLLERTFHLRRLGKRPSWISLLERGPDRGPTAIDLFDAQEQGRAWIRDRTGFRRPSRRPVPRLATRMNRRPLGVWLGPLGGGIDFELEIPPSAVFQADIGLASLRGEDGPHRHAQHARLGVSIARNQRFETLRWDRVLGGEQGGRWWNPIEVDLSAYARERVTLRLELIPDAQVEPGRMAFWGSPRIALPPESTP